MQIGFSKNISETLLEDIFELILNNLIENKKLKIAKFGTFELRKKKEWENAYEIYESAVREIFDEVKAIAKLFQS